VYGDADFQKGFQVRGLAVKTNYEAAS